MSEKNIEQFAALLVRQVRDVAIQNCDRELRPRAKTPIAARWRASAAVKGSVDPSVVIPDCVDETVFALLSAIDQGLLRLSFTDPDGNNVDLADDGHGELAGWYMGSGGWRGKYSKERFVDDFADLDIP